MSKAPIRKNKGWRQYRSLEVAAADQDARIKRLKKKKLTQEELDVIDGLLDDDAVPGSVLLESAFSRVAQYWLEVEQARKIAKLMSAGPMPIHMVTVVNPAYWCRRKHLPTYDPDAFRQSIKHALAKVEAAQGHDVVAVGRVDFNLLEVGGKILIRTHAHLVIAGAEKDSLKKMLQPRYHKAEHPKLRAVRVDDVKNIGALRYALKCQIKGLPSDSWISRGKKKGRKPASANYQVAFDRWLLGRRLTNTLILYGVRRYGDELRLTE